MSRSSRIVVNTVATYARLAVAAGSGLIVVPIVLRTLGTIDFGIFSVITGSLSGLLFINSALTGGAQRHIAYALGEGSSERARQWFQTSLLIHACVAVGLLAVALMLSHWVVYKFLVVPPSRFVAAMWIYRAVVLVLFCSVISTPYQALIVAKESIGALSLMTMAGPFALMIGACLMRILPGDHLMWYSGIYCVSDGLLLVGPVFFCIVRYAECRRLHPRSVSWQMIRELLGFSSWNLVGTMAVQIRYQGPSILFNRFFGTTANAANGIAMQVSGFASGVSTALLCATAPPIVKAEASGQRSDALFLSNLSNKYAFVLLWLMLGPLLFELKYCLTLWLRQMPTDTVVFTSALLVVLLIDMLTAGYGAPVQAEGRIGTYQCVLGLLICISVPAGYVLLRFHLPAQSVLWAMAGGSVLAGSGRLWFLCRRLGLRAADWVQGVLIPSAVICSVCSFMMALVVLSVRTGMPRLVLLYCINSAISVLLAWAFANSERERLLCRSYVLKLREHTFSGSRRMFALATRRP